MMNDSLNIAIAGATGYVGLELVRILSKHPKVKILYLCATKSIGKSQMDMVSEVKKINEYEVEVNLATPNADLVNSLGTFHFNVIQDGVTDFSTAIGTGPYRCKEFKPGVRTVGTPFENCWHGPGYLDEMVAENILRFLY